MLAGKVISRVEVSILVDNPVTVYGYEVVIVDASKIDRVVTCRIVVCVCWGKVAV